VNYTNGVWLLARALGGRDDRTRAIVASQRSQERGHTRVRAVAVQLRGRGAINGERQAVPQQGHVH